MIQPKIKVKNHQNTLRLRKITHQEKKRYLRSWTWHCRSVLRIPFLLLEINPSNQEIKSAQMENGNWRIPKGRNESLGLDSANSTKTESELRGDGRKARRTKGIPWWWSRYSPRGLVCILFVDVDGSMEMGEGFAWWQRERVDFTSGFWFGGASRFHQILGAWKGGRREEGWIHCIRDQLEYGATRACLWAHVGVGETMHACGYTWPNGHGSFQSVQETCCARLGHLFRWRPK